MRQLKMAATEIVESQIMICFYCPNSDKLKSNMYIKLKVILNMIWWYYNKKVMQ